MLVPFDGPLPAVGTLCARAHSLYPRAASLPSASAAARYITGEAIAVDGGLARVGSAPRAGAKVPGTR